MKITILADNEAREGLECEWGLSMVVEHEGRTVLLDAGATDLFARNADVLGIDLAAVDAAALSHAHFDHAGGLEAFFGANGEAKLYMRPSSENCYTTSKGMLEYIGIPLGVLGRYADRIVEVGEATEMVPGVWALPHSTEGLSEKGAAGRMFVGPRYEGKLPDEGELVADDFDHELTLVVDLGDSIVAINSCSHSGPDVVVEEAMRAFPGRRVKALIGGFHLFMTPADEVRDLALRLKDLGVDLVCAGHCTGADAFSILREELGEDVVLPTSAGLTLSL